MLRGSYSWEADAWSIGVMLYIMLCGMPVRIFMLSTGINIEELVEMAKRHLGPRSHSMLPDDPFTASHADPAPAPW